MLDHAAGTGAEAHDGEAGHVVDVDGALVEVATGVHDAAEHAVVGVAVEGAGGAHVLKPDAGACAEESLGDGALGHFE